MSLLTPGSERSGLAATCERAAADLGQWLRREVDDFERLSPGQSLAVDAWALLSLAAERVDQLESQVGHSSSDQSDAKDSKTAGAAPIRDMAAASVVVEARRRSTPPAGDVPATGWSNSPMEGWTTHLAAWAAAGRRGAGRVRALLRFLTPWLHYAGERS